MANTLPLQVVSFAAYTAVGDGVADDTAAIQRAINAARDLAIAQPNSRVVVIGNDGTFRTTAALEMASNVTVLCLPGCVILRAENLVAGSNDRVTFPAGVTDAAWIGGVFLRTKNSVLGNVFSVDGASRITIADIVIRGWQKDASTFIEGWRGGKGIAVWGDDIRILNPTMTDPHIDTDEEASAAGGIRVSRGKRFMCIGGSIEAGDDCVAFAPAPRGRAATSSATPRSRMR